MKHLETYESTNNPFIEMVEYIKDICLDIKDEGFSVNVTRESYWKSNNKNLTNRFSASHKNDPTSKKLLMIKVSISKNPDKYVYTRESFNASKAKDTFIRIVNYLGDSLLLGVNDRVPLVNFWYGPGITYTLNNLSKNSIDKTFNETIDKAEFNFHIDDKIKTHLESYGKFKSTDELDMEDIKNIFFSCYEEMFDSCYNGQRMEFIENGILNEKIKSNTFYIMFSEILGSVKMGVYTNGFLRPFDLKDFEDRISPYKISIGDVNKPKMLYYISNGSVNNSLMRETLFFIE